MNVPAVNATSKRRKQLATHDAPIVWVLPQPCAATATADPTMVAFVRITPLRTRSSDLTVPDVS